MPPPVASTTGRSPPSTCVERLALEPPVVVLAVQREDLVEGQPGRLLDPAVELDEGHLQPPRQPPPDRALARAAQAEERDGGQAGLAAGAGEQLGGGRPQRAGQRRQLAHGDVRLAGLDLDQEARREVGPAGQLAQRAAAGGAQRPRAAAERREQEVGAPCVRI